MPHPEFDALVPDWPAPASVQALFTCRAGGVSQGRYAGLNLGLHVGDAPASVAENRRRLQAAIAVPTAFLNQVHGCDMAQLQPDTAYPQDPAQAIAADGAYTTQAQVACTVMVADCLPVLLCDTQGQWVAAAHAGWRGLFGAQGRGVLEAAVQTMPRNAQGPDQLMAWLGPCIGPSAFEVGDDVRQAFVAATPEAASCFQAHAPGKWLADLPALAGQRLRALGVTQIYGNDGSQDWCTVTHPSRFFSHRRDGVSGRMAASIWRVR